MISDTQGQQYADNVVNGILPDQISFNREEVKLLVDTLLEWSAQQIEDLLAGLNSHDLESLVANCEFDTPKEALEDMREDWSEQIGATADFIRKHYGSI